jgi:hypothetical protein
MRRTLAVLVLIALSVGMAKTSDDEAAFPPLKVNKVTPDIDVSGLFVGDDKPVGRVDFSRIDPKNDVRLTKLKDSQPTRVGVLSYYANKGGGYTFMEGEDMLFYSLPYLPTRDKCPVMWTVNGGPMQTRVVVTLDLFSIGTTKMPDGGQTVYRSEMKEILTGIWRREDIPIADWSREVPYARCRLTLFDDDRETRLKLKSIVPVLEHGEHGR